MQRRRGSSFSTPFQATPSPHSAAQGLTHKVRSLGMWLKLDTGMVVMLLLFRVLVGGKPESLGVWAVGSDTGRRDCASL